MGYAREFRSEEYAIPGFLFTNIDWEDVSWHNDVCPRWESERLRIAIWVDCIDPTQREYDDWKQYTVCSIVREDDGTFSLAEDEPLFATEDAVKLENWIAAYDAYWYIDGAIDAIQHSATPNEEICDELHTVYSMLTAYLRLCEVPDTPPT
jgi:hypothetical protein